MAEKGNIAKRILRFYADGFRNMTVGRTLWAIIIVKLVVIFAVLKVFFFPDILSTRYDNDAERAAAVRSALSAPESADKR
jgi:hypothetical protein